MCDVAPVTVIGGDDTKVDGAKWVCLWRTLLLSSLGKTAYPYLYCRSIRALDLKDLEELFQEPRFRDRYSQELFAGDLAPFLVEDQSPFVYAKTRAKSVKRLNIKATLDRVGDAITSCSPMLEELAGPISHDALLRWGPRLKNLQQLRLWDGAELAGTGSIIGHCPRFTLLKFYNWLGDSTDASFAAFLLDLRSNSLESIEVFSGSDSGPEVISALNHHSRSLIELKLGQVRSNVLSSLHMLRSPSALKVLHLNCFRGSMPIPTEDWSQLSAWLRSCASLENVSLQGFNYSHNILTPFLLDPKVHLSKLEVEYSCSNAKAFHSALSHQGSSLTSFILRSDGEDCDADALVSALTSLNSLIDLRLFGVSDYFQDHHIIAVADSMPMLEELVISGWGISDAVWAALAGLRRMRRLDLNALSTFTLGGILNYIEKLGEGNWGLSLAIMLDTTCALQEDEQTLVKEVLAKKVEGRFDYTVARGKNSLFTKNSMPMIQAFVGNPGPDTSSPSHCHE